MSSLFVALAERLWRQSWGDSYTEEGAKRGLMS